VSWRRQTSLLFAALLLAGCSSGPPAKPQVPDSISPGWKLSAMSKSATPAGVPGDGPPTCWKADYSGAGSAGVWICWYKATANAFDAVQRVPAQAQMVKFQEEHYFVLVQWNNAPKANLAALVRAIQKALKT
jgi:hypothetical protein